MVKGRIPSPRKSFVIRLHKAKRATISKFIHDFGLSACHLNLLPWGLTVALGSQVTCNEVKGRRQRWRWLNETMDLVISVTIPVIALIVAATVILLVLRRIRKLTERTTTKLDDFSVTVQASLNLCYSDIERLHRIEVFAG
jgi:hypothetical protein